MSTAEFQLLLIPLLRDIAHFRLEFRELDRQFETIRDDPHARSNNPDKQRAYKARVLRWYYQGIPQAKQDLLQRLLDFWSAMPSAVAVMAFYNEAKDDMTAVEIDIQQREVVGLVQTVSAMFTSMRQLQLLNPKWSGAGRYPLFTMAGSVLQIEPGSERAAAWTGFL